jgi:hypothetical protein
MKSTVILDKGDTGFGVYVPDLPGCVAAGHTKEEAIEPIADRVSHRAFYRGASRKRGTSASASSFRGAS